MSDTSCPGCPVHYTDDGYDECYLGLGAFDMHNPYPTTCPHAEALRQVAESPDTLKLVAVPVEAERRTGLACHPDLPDRAVHIIQWTTDREVTE